jgi:hypothetical protein
VAAVFGASNLPLVFRTDRLSARFTRSFQQAFDALPFLGLKTCGAIAFSVLLRLLWQFATARFAKPLFNATI